MKDAQESEDGDFFHDREREREQEEEEEQEEDLFVFNDNLDGEGGRGREGGKERGWVGDREEERERKSSAC